MDANVTQLFKNDERAYLEFCALFHIRELKKIAPDHPLVEAVEAKLDELKEKPFKLDTNSARCPEVLGRDGKSHQCRLLRGHDTSHEFDPLPLQLDLFD